MGQVGPVEAFLEKPDYERAKAYVEAGNYLWNSGMFIFKASTIMDEIKTHMSAHYETLMKIDAEIQKGLTKVELSEATKPYFSEFEKISIDFGVMENPIASRSSPAVLHGMTSDPSMHSETSSQ